MQRSAFKVKFSLSLTCISEIPFIENFLFFEIRANPSWLWSLLRFIYFHSNAQYKLHVCYLYNKYVSLLDINHTQLIISLIYRLKDFIKNIDDLLNGYIYTTKDVIDFCKIKIIYKQMKWLIGERDN